MSGTEQHRGAKSTCVTAPTTDARARLCGISLHFLTSALYAMSSHGWPMHTSRRSLDVPYAVCAVRGCINSTVFLLQLAGPARVRRLFFPHCAMCLLILSIATATVFDAIVSAVHGSDEKTEVERSKSRVSQFAVSSRRLSRSPQPSREPRIRKDESNELSLITVRAQIRCVNPSPFRWWSAAHLRSHGEPHSKVQLRACLFEKLSEAFTGTDTP